MKCNFFSVMFWFNIFTEHNVILEVLQNELKEDFSNFNVYNSTNNLTMPILVAQNNKKMLDFSFSQINFQYNMGSINFSDFSTFKDKVLKIFEVLTDNNVEILHTSIFVNAEMIEEDALNELKRNLLSSKINDSNLIDVDIKIGKKYDDQFYKIVEFLNKKQVKVPNKIDEFGRRIPIPLISWKECMVEKELIEVSYEMNDKYSFDNSNNYRTSEFHLNKMLYLIEENFESDIESIISKGKL